MSDVTSGMTAMLERALRTAKQIQLAAVKSGDFARAKEQSASIRKLEERLAQLHMAAHQPVFAHKQYLSHGADQ